MFETSENDDNYCQGFIVFNKQILHEFFLIDEHLKLLKDSLDLEVIPLRYRQLDS